MSNDDSTPKPSSVRDRWLKKIAREKKAHENFRKQAKKAESSFYQDGKGDGQVGEPIDTKAGQVVPMFWSNTKVLHAALFSRMPRPDVRKRNIDVPDSTARNISMVTERALTFVQDTTSYDNDAHQAVNDFLVCGLGQGKIEMEVETQDIPMISPMTGQPLVMEDGKPFLQTVVVSRTLLQRYIHWDNYHWEPTTSWDQVSWMAYDHWMGKEELEDRFDVTLPDKASGDGPNKTNLQADKYECQYCVHEIWDKRRREVVFVCDGYEDVLDTQEDPLGLKDFFPSPRPMMANVKGSEVIPKPDFTFIRRSLELINLYASRIESLTRQIKDWGYYDASFGEAVKVNQAEDGTYFPIQGLVERLGMAGAGVDGANVFASIDNSKKAAVILNLIDQFERQKQLLWEMIGLADIMRGSSNPNETASAQRIKDQWANVRLAPYLNTISQFFRDCFRIIAEVISEKFEPQQIQQMTGIEITPEMQEVMQNDFLRTYAVDVETDSTIAQDDNLEREQRNETSKTVGEMLQTLVPAMQAGQLPADLGKALLSFTVRTTKYGREFDDAINALPDTQQQLGQLQQQLQQGQQQIQQLEQQLQEAQGQLRQVNEGEEQRANVKTQTDAQDTTAAAQLKQVQAAKIAQEVQMGQVFPMVRQ